LEEHHIAKPPCHIDKYTLHIQALDVNFTPIGASPDREKLLAAALANTSAIAMGFVLRIARGLPPTRLATTTRIRLVSLLDNIQESAP